MKFITAPTVIMIGRSSVTPYCIDLVPKHDSAAEILCAAGSKVCYDAHGKDGRAVSDNIQKCLGNEHYSVLEHAVFSFLVTGVSRGLSHELVRHRHLSFSQRSTRYTEEGDERVVLEPRIAQVREAAKEYDAHASINSPSAEARVMQGHAASLQWREYEWALTEEFRWYRSQAILFTEQFKNEGLSKVELRKKARGASRQLLPHALETQFVVTGNLRTWREVILLRSERHAEAEIRRLMSWIAPILIEQAPNAFADFEKQDVDGFPEYTRYTAKDRRIDELTNEVRYWKDMYESLIAQSEK